MHRWTAVISLLATSCIFGGGDDPKGSQFDLGETNNGGVDQGHEHDSGAEDTGIVVVDLGSTPDMSPPADLGRPDMGTPPEDMGQPDMGPPPPFRLLAEVDVALNGTNPIPGLAPQVSMFAEGFLAGYASTSNTAEMAYFTPQAPGPVATHSAPAGQLAIDFAGDATFGYATIPTSSRQTVFKFEVGPNNELMFEEEFAEASTSSVSYHEMTVAMVGNYPYMGEIRYSSGWHVDIGVWGVNGYGTATDMLNFELQNLEAIGGAQPQRQLLVAGQSPNGYRLLDFNWTGDRWENTAYGCGAMPTQADRGRIVPLREQWVLLRRSQLNGTSQLMLTRCSGDAGQTLDLPIQTPMAGDVFDFDVAEETVLSGQVGFAWAKGNGVWFAVMTPDAAQPQVEAVWQIPNAAGNRVRAAYNSSTNVFAVLVQNPNGSKLYLFEFA